MTKRKKKRKEKVTKTEQKGIIEDEANIMKSSKQAREKTHIKKMARTPLTLFLFVLDSQLPGAGGALLGVQHI